MSRFRTFAAGIGLVAALALTGCGGSDGSSGSDGGSKAEPGFTDKSAADIAQAAKDDMAALDTVKFSGDITSDGQATQLDIQLSTSGDCTGTIGLAGAQAELLSVDGKVWFKPDEAFWKAQAPDQADAIIAAVGDKWVTLPATDDSFSGFCDLNKLLDELLSGDTEATYEKGDVESVDGQDAIAITRTDQKDGDSVGYVLVGENHYLVKISKEGDTNKGTVTFSEFNEKFDVEAPAADDQIDISALGG